MTTMSDQRELVITRMFDAPRELVFRCWTDPTHLVRWWGPKGSTALFVSVDLTEGGAWRTCISDPADGRELWSSGVYLEIVPPERLVFSFAWEGAAEPEDTLVTITFAERDGKTEMTFHQSGFDTVESRDGHIEGWQECFDDLIRHLVSSDRRS
jgi:uncharacterized protein YndB with AHSA1/START domain